MLNGKGEKRCDRDALSAGIRDVDKLNEKCSGREERVGRRNAGGNGKKSLDEENSEVSCNEPGRCNESDAGKPIKHVEGEFSTDTLVSIAADAAAAVATTEAQRSMEIFTSPNSAVESYGDRQVEPNCARAPNSRSNSTALCQSNPVNRANSRRTISFAVTPIDRANSAVDTLWSLWVLIDTAIEVASSR
jgi:hypothetical protein